MSLPPDGQRQLPDLDDVVTGIAALEANRALPFVIEPAPETVAALEASHDDKAARALDALRRLAAEHPVVARPYVPLSLPSLVQADLPTPVEVCGASTRCAEYTATLQEAGLAQLQTVFLGAAVCAAVAGAVALVTFRGVGTDDVPPARAIGVSG